MSLENPPILIIDDEEIVLLAIAESLKTEGYEIVKTTNPHEAIELLSQQEFGVIISDHHMPGMTGLEFFGEANKIQPMASRILITGVLTLKVVVDAINKGEIFRFIAKPWIREELLATVKNAINRFELMSQNYRLQQQTQSSNQELIQHNEELEQENRQLKHELRQGKSSSTEKDGNLNNALDLTLRIVHSFDAEIGRECQQIVDICDAMVKTGKVPESQVQILRIASYISSLGKISIERSMLKDFLNNANDLGPDELEYFHNIPIYSQLHSTIFENYPGLPHTVRASHERIDGRGYPDGLIGANIPPAAKFLAIAVFYAESNLGTQQTLERIRQMSGTAFDPIAVSVFLEANTGLNLRQKTRSVFLNDLNPGMVIGEDLRYPSGALLLAAGSSLSEATIRLLKNSSRINLPKESFVIYS